MELQRRIDMFAEGTYEEGDTICIAIRGSSIFYSKNGHTLHISNGVIDDSSYPLSVDTSLYHPGATLSKVKVSVLD